MSDVKLHLTQVHYNVLLDLSQSVSRVLRVDSQREFPTQLAISASIPSSPASSHSSINLEPELRKADGGHAVWTTLELAVFVNTIKLHLYDAGAHSESNLQQYGIARFALNNNSLRYKSLSDGATETQLVVKSFTMSNSQPGRTRFREIIPAAQHGRNQFMLLYSATSGPAGTALAVVTVDSPQIIFSMDPVFALLEFFTSRAAVDSPSPESTGPIISQSELPTEPQRTLDFRIDLHDVAISVLENDQDPNTQAIKLSVKQVLISQQVRNQAEFLSFADRHGLGDHGSKN